MTNITIVSDDDIAVQANGRGAKKSEKTKAVETAIQEFADSGKNACVIEWAAVDKDFDRAKRFMSSTLHFVKKSNSNFENIALRTNRDSAQVFLIRKG